MVPGVRARDRSTASWSVRCGELTSQQLQRICPFAVHRGVSATVRVRPEATWELALGKARRRRALSTRSQREAHVARPARGHQGSWPWPSSLSSRPQALHFGLNSWLSMDTLVFPGGVGATRMVAGPQSASSRRLVVAGPSRTTPGPLVKTTTPPTRGRSGHQAQPSRALPLHALWKCAGAWPSQTQ